MRPRLTLNLGLRYEIFSAPDEADGLALSPVGVEDDPLGVLLSNATIDFAGKSVGRPFHKLDRNNFAPVMGFAWNFLGAGDAVLRGAYSLHYVNDETIRTANFATQAIEGLFVRPVGRVPGDVQVYLEDLSASPLAIPDFRMPLTLEDTFPNNGLQDIAAIDPRLRTPMVHQWSLGFQQRVAGSILEARYVGNKALRLTRTLDFNTPIIRENGFLEDFVRARSNGELAQEAGIGFSPGFNPLISGSQPLTVFPSIGAGGALDDPTVRGLIQTGQAAALAQFYQNVGLEGNLQFLPNPLTVASAYLTNSSSATYHALQVDMRRRLRDGLQFQANYAFSKVLADAEGIDAQRFDPYLDPNNGSIEKSRAPFDLTHAIKANFIWELPLLKRRSETDTLARLLGGWSVSGVLTWQSGAPFSIVSGRGTINAEPYSILNTVDPSITKGEIDGLLGVRQTGGGPSFIAPSAIASDGSGSLRLFANPQPGEAGALQRRLFSGPWTFNLDFAILKTFKFGESSQVEFRGEAANVFNNSSWIVGNQNINQPQFGRITNVAYDSRRIQLGLYYRF